VTTRVGAVGVEETTGTGGLLRSGGRLEAFPMPLGSERTLGLAGPNGTPLIGELPAPADPAGGVSCAKACPDRHKLPSTERTSTVMRDIRPSGNFNNKVSRGFPQARRSTSFCDVRLVVNRTGLTPRPLLPVCPDERTSRDRPHSSGSCQKHAYSRSSVPRKADCTNRCRDRTCGTSETRQ
jgi:hypothetical protein